MYIFHGRSRTGVQLKDKWRNLIKFQHLRQDEAAKVPYKSAVRAANASSSAGAKTGTKGANANAGGKKAPGGIVAKKTAQAGGNKGGKKTTPAANATNATTTTTTKGGKAAGASAAAAAKKTKTTAVSRDALKKKASPVVSAKNATLSAKERLKATYAQQKHASGADGSDEYVGGVRRADGDAGARADDSGVVARGPRGKFSKAKAAGKAKIMNKADTEATRVVEQLKAKRRDMVNEVEAAERELARMKTVVEEAEAVYSQARARVHDALIGMHHGEHGGDGGDMSDDHDDTDWDKYLAFGAHESDGEDDDKDAVVAEAAQAAAAAHEAITSAKKPKSAASEQRVPVPDIDDDDATDHDDSDDEEIDEDLVQSDLDDLDEDERNMLRANEALAAAGLPPMHEIEHILLTELKKLEAANAAVVHARLALEAVDAEFAEALANVVQEDVHHDLEEHFAAIEDESDDDESDDDESGDDDDDEEEEEGDDEAVMDEDDDVPESAPAPKGAAAETTETKKSSKAKTSAAAPSVDASAGAGGRVVEDRRYGIYDARRYRTEAENDAEAAATVAKGGGGAKATAAPKRKAGAPASAPKVSADAAKKKKTTTKAAVEPISEHLWYEQPNVNAVKTVAVARNPPKSSRAPAATPGAIPQWRRKRTATRVTIGRPVAGPTSWAAIGQHIIHDD